MAHDHHLTKARALLVTFYIVLTVAVLVFFAARSASMRPPSVLTDQQINQEVMLQPENVGY